jgi:hypothetical protein
MPKYRTNCPNCLTGNHPDPFSVDKNKGVCWCCGAPIKESSGTIDGTSSQLQKPQEEVTKKDKLPTCTVYKVLDSEYKSTVQHFSWPLPTKEEPGPWLDMEGIPILCVRGYHGWLNKEKAFREASSREVKGAHVYEMEIEGEIRQDKEKACGTRARLVKEIFLMPTISWERYVKSEPSAFKIVEEAARIHAAMRYTGTNEYGNTVTHNPCVPSFHEGELTPWVDHPNMCGTCGLNAELHDGWQGRHELSEKLTHFDRYELILYIQQLLNGKDPGLDMGKSEGS